MEQRISLITLGVADVERASAFYRALGWRDQSPPGAEVAFFQAGGMVVALWGREETAADNVIDPAPENAAGWGGVGLAQNQRSREEVDRLIEEVRAAGGRIVREPAPTDWGGYSAAFHDPDGHPWEIAHNPDWPMATDGSVTLPY